MKCDGDISRHAGMIYTYWVDIGKKENVSQSVMATFPSETFPADHLALLICFN